MIKGFAILIGVGLAVALGLPIAAFAAETETGQEITISRNDAVSGDLYLFGRTVAIAGTVNGDLTGIVDSIRITGTGVITGTINLAARKVVIAGTVHGTVRTTAAEVTIAGVIDGDLIVAGGEVKVTAGGAIGGDLLIGNGSLTIEGPVAGDVTGTAGEVSINSTIGGSVRLGVADLTLKDKAAITGDLLYASNVSATIDESAVVIGQTIRSSAFRASGGPNLFAALTSHLMRLFAGLLAGLVLLILLPKPVIATAEVIRSQFLNSALTGVTSIVFWAALAIGLMVLVVGIPIALVGSILLLGVAYLSQVFAGLALGRIVLPPSWRVASRGYNILAMAIGMIIFGAIRAIPFPYVSFGVGAIIAVIGIGGVLLAFKSRVAIPVSVATTN